MKCYLSYFKLKLITGLQYRTSAIAGTVTQFFFGLLNIMIFLAFFESGSGNASMTIAETTTYFWLNQSFFAMIAQTYKDSELFDLVKTGNISYEMTRPKNIYFMWYAKIIGTRLAQTMLRSLPVIIIACLLPNPYNLSLPESPLHLLLAITSLLIGFLLSTAIITLYPIITLKTLNEKGIVSFVIAFADILSGLVIPIPFFPPILKFISAYLPFQYISDLPFRIYNGNIGISDGLMGILVQFIWIFITIMIGYTLLNISLKRVEVQGG